jgi:serine/threonine-protein kinase
MTGGGWDDEGNLVVGTGVPSATGVLRIPQAGGAATPMLELASGELFHVQPQVLPGGTALLFQTVSTPPNQSNIDVVSIADGRRKTLVRGGGSPRYLASGHLVYMNRATMFAVPFDVERLETRGTAVPVLDDVAYDAMANGAQFDVSSTGTLVYRRGAGAASPTSTVRWVAQGGSQQPVLAKPGVYLGTPRVSPDGKRIALGIQDGANHDIWVYEPSRDAMTRLTQGGGAFGIPVWTRDGRHVVFGAIGRGILWSRADGAGQPEVLQSSRSLQFPTSFTPDGTRLAYFQADGNPQLWSVPIEPGAGGLKAGTPERFLTTKFVDIDAAFSPDGRWLAYSSNESGRHEVYVRAFPASPSTGGGRVLISNSGGQVPVWSPNGRELLFLAGTQIMAVGYSATGDSFIAAKPRVWADNVRAVVGFDLAPDGGRAVVNVPVSTPETSRQERSIVFVLNFFDELRRRAPVGR